VFSGEHTVDLCVIKGLKMAGYRMIFGIVQSRFWTLRICVHWLMRRDILQSLASGHENVACGIWAFRYTNSASVVFAKRNLDSWKSFGCLPGCR